MKTLIQNTLTPFAIFTAGVLLMGCEQASEIHAEEMQTAPSADISVSDQGEAATTTASELKQGNMFYIVRDVADLQLKAGDYVEQLKQTQTELQAAITAQDQQQLQTTANTLQQQLTGFNQALTGLNLKSQEIDSIRQNIMQANQQVLATPLLNGEVDLSQVDVKKIQQQMGSIQVEMIKLAGMLIPTEENSAEQDLS